MVARTTAIIQARMGSTRLQGKALVDIAGKTMLDRVVTRVGQARLVDAIMVATTTEDRDDPLAQEAHRLGVAVFRGSEEDVLDRYVRAAQACRADVVVRITSDCPLIDPGVIDDVVTRFVAEDADYASNTLERSYPRGLDVEVMTTAALERSRREADAAYQRVHVTPFLYEHPKLFKLVSVVSAGPRSDLRWTVDTPEDLALVRALYARLSDRTSFSWTDVLAIVIAEPALAMVNAESTQKELRDG